VVTRKHKNNETGSSEDNEASSSRERNGMYKT